MRFCADVDYLHCTHLCLVNPVSCKNILIFSIFYPVFLLKMNFSLKFNIFSLKLQFNFILIFQYIVLLLILQKQLIRKRKEFFEGPNHLIIRYLLR